MATTPVLDLQAGDQVRHLGGWFTLAAQPVPRTRGDRLELRFIGGSHRTVHWLAHITTNTTTGDNT